MDALSNLKMLKVKKIGELKQACAFFLEKHENNDTAESLALYQGAKKDLAREEESYKLIGGK